jgi:hypothetical protein
VGCEKELSYPKNRWPKCNGLVRPKKSAPINWADLILAWLLHGLKQAKFGFMNF